MRALGIHRRRRWLRGVSVALKHVDVIVACSAEGQVSHIFAAKMSSLVLQCLDAV